MKQHVAMQTSAPGTFEPTAALERLGGDEALLRELVSIFLEDGPTTFAELQQAVSAGDSRAIQRACHSLRGSASAIGAVEFASLARELECAGRSADLAAAQEFFARTERPWRELRRALVGFVVSLAHEDSQTEDQS